MTIYDTYGTKSHKAKELAGLLAPLLDLAFAEHDSYFRGEYLKAEAGGTTIEIQSNAIPGDGEEDDLYASEHAASQTLVLVTAPAPDSALNSTLTSVEGLEALSHEAL
ncbi:hypothetical protein [Streptomyces violascens]|uniref:hypothetical protein n=1 Tax=Streptomyces violascens TaxID=67381 RepID=UPI001674767C|nr:hypothetical protein [Streptomyces violascens]GGU52058.1 hypothetical protein GCM10010289_85430 [Streptomyces violascens]